jgi:hypothetical protein
MVPHLLASFTCVIGLHLALLAKVLLASNTSHSILTQMDGGFMSEFFAVVIFLVDVEIALLDLNHSSAWANRHVWVILDIIIDGHLFQLFFFLFGHIFSDLRLLDLAFTSCMWADDRNVVFCLAEHVFGETILMQFVEAFGRL